MKIQDGTYKVIGKSGVLVNLVSLLGDIKVIKGKRGYNKMLGVKWGTFTVKSNGDILDLVYDNGKIVDKILSYHCAKSKYMGIFYYKGKDCGIFELQKYEKS